MQDKSNRNAMQSTEAARNGTGTKLWIGSLAEQSQKQIASVSETMSSKLDGITLFKQRNNRITFKVILKQNGCWQLGIVSPVCKLITNV